MSQKTHKILLTGGGTGGSVSPLLAMAEDFTEGEVEFLWLGTKTGPEKAMVEKAGIRFRAIPAGKLRRYFSWRNFTDIILIFAGFVQSFFIMIKWRPDLAISAGGFVSVPVIWAAWVLGVPILIHQQDVRPGLANKLMAPFAKVITVTFEKSLRDYGKKAVWTGNPVRRSILLPLDKGGRGDLGNSKNNTNHLNFLNITLNNLPLILVVGGGTGSAAINKFVWENLDKLVKVCQVIHITGQGKKDDLKFVNYHSFEFLNVDQMAEALYAADVVVSRCGLGTLTELSFLGKPSILIPMPDTHQEDNAAVFAEKAAAVVLDQKELDVNKFFVQIESVLNDRDLRMKLSGNIKMVMKEGGNEQIKLIILKFLV